MGKIQRAIHCNVGRSFLDLNKKAIVLFFELSDQLMPDQRIQYVTVEPSKERDALLGCGLIKKTKKPGFDRFIVPKDVMFVSEFESGDSVLQPALHE